MTLATPYLGNLPDPGHEAMVGTIRSVLELLFFLSGCVLAVAGLFALQQVNLLKADMTIRNERAAKENAILYITRYLSEYVKVDDASYEKYKSKKLSAYSGPIGDFGPGSIPRGLRKQAAERFKIIEGVFALSAYSGPIGDFGPGSIPRGLRKQAAERFKIIEEYSL